MPGQGRIGLGRQREGGGMGQREDEWMKKKREEERLETRKLAHCIPLISREGEKEERKKGTKESGIQRTEGLIYFYFLSFSAYDNHLGSL